MEFHGKRGSESAAGGSKFDPLFHGVSMVFHGQFLTESCDFEPVSMEFHGKRGQKRDPGGAKCDPLFHGISMVFHGQFFSGNLLRSFLEPVSMDFHGKRLKNGFARFFHGAQGEAFHGFHGKRGGPV